MATNPDAIDDIDDPAGDPADPPAAPPAANDPPAADPPAADPPEPFKLPDDFDWRTHWAAGDDKLLKLAGRYASPKALLEATAALRTKLSSGKVIEPLGEDATDEEKAAYRKSMDIPDAPADYLAKLPDGLVIGEDDKPIVEAFLGKMHAANAPQGVTNAALDAYYEIVDQQNAAEIEATEQAKKACEDTLRSEWETPGEYRRNENILQNYVGALPEAVRDAFDKGVGPDGVPLGYNPEIRKWLVARALEDNPVATVVPGAGANQASAIADEIATLEDFMAKNRTAWFRDEAKQARYQELISAQEKLQARG
jgi:hypothetical protein